MSRVDALQQAILDGNIGRARSVARSHPSLLETRSEAGLSVVALARRTGRAGMYVAMLRMTGATPPKPRELLREAMAAISEDVACAGWLQDVEFILWHLVTTRQALSKGTDPCGFSRLSNDELDDLQWLGEQAAGWWRWDEAEGSEVFVDREAWLSTYPSWIPR